MEPVLFLRALFFALLLPGTVTGLVPWLLLHWDAGGFDIGEFRHAGLLPLSIGALGLLWCIADFARIGRGTLATVDPPRVFVSQGLYRFVRNPMYVSVFLILIGESVFFQTWLIAAWGAVAVTEFHLFVVLYEEPHLTKTFGATYEEYRRTMPRWIPRLSRRVA